MRGQRCGRYSVTAALCEGDSDTTPLRLVSRSLPAEGTIGPTRSVRCSDARRGAGNSQCGGWPWPQHSSCSRSASAPALLRFMPCSPAGGEAASPIITKDFPPLRTAGSHSAEPPPSASRRRTLGITRITSSDYISRRAGAGNAGGEVGRLSATSKGDNITFISPSPDFSVLGDRLCLPRSVLSRNALAFGPERRRWVLAGG